MMTIQQLVDGLSRRRFTATEVVAEFLGRIEHSRFNSFITVNTQEAKAQAAALDQRLAAGETVGRLAGLPLAIKDVIVTYGLRSTGGSKILDNYMPPYDATVVSKVKRAGAIILGKTNCDEFAMGSSGENSGYGATLNPWRPSAVPGGSSSGSAAAVAAGEAMAALGTDTGGSIRQPAAFCGIVGLKTTYGRVSRKGLMAMASSLDQAGPLTRCVEDAAAILQEIAGYDPGDATSSRRPVPDYLGGLSADINGLRVGVAKEFFAEGLAPEIKELIEAAIKKLESLGGRLVEVSLPTLTYALAVYYVICPSEVSANLARYDGIRYGLRENAKTLSEVYQLSRGRLLGAEVKRRIMLGTYVLSAGYYDAYYRRAWRARQMISRDFAKVFSQVDILAAPTTPTAAFDLGSKNTDPLAMYLADIYTVPVNIAGLPAISVPCGFTQEKLPVGLQLIGPPWSEDRLLRVAYHYEQSELWYKVRPTVVNYSI